jgi:hypothetical protein
MGWEGEANVWSACEGLSGDELVCLLAWGGEPAEVAVRLFCGEREVALRLGFSLTGVVECSEARVSVCLGSLASSSIDVNVLNTSCSSSSSLVRAGVG